MLNSVARSIYNDFIILLFAELLYCDLGMLLFFAAYDILVIFFCNEMYVKIILTICDPPWWNWMNIKIGMTPLSSDNVLERVVVMVCLSLYIKFLYLQLNEWRSWSVWPLNI